MKNFETGIQRGEFRGDVTRDTFHPEKTYSRVLLQQGRVQIDADWNEQVSIFVHHLRNLASDLGGPHWGPHEGHGFAIALNDNKDLAISPGHYYVGGILCENDTDATYKTQPNFPAPADLPTPNARQGVLVYLDVWERHISAAEDDGIREAALGGPDTASRAKIIWQVKTLLVPSGSIATDGNSNLPFKSNYNAFLAAIARLVAPGTGRMTARAMDPSAIDTEPCLVEPKARYRGAENQLYRVEIHTAANDDSPGTYKWSRNNSSVTYPVSLRADANTTVTLTLEHLGQDDRFSLKTDDWVELLDDDDILRQTTVNLLQIMAVDPENRQVTLKGLPSSQAGKDPAKNPCLRRWDQRNGNRDGIPIKLGTPDKLEWVELEDGVQIAFTGNQDEKNPNLFRAGDYWLIPARQITGDVEWPVEDGKPQALLAHGVSHHYAPLALIPGTSRTAPGTAGGLGAPVDLRRILTQLWT